MPQTLGHTLTGGMPPPFREGLGTMPSGKRTLTSGGHIPAPVISDIKTTDDKKTTDKTPRRQPSPEDIERGKAFAAWFRAACGAARVTPSSLAKELKVTSGYLYTLINGGIKTIDGVDWFKRPSVDLVMRLAQTLDASLPDGLRAAGYSADTQPHVPTVIAELPASVQQGLAAVLRELKNTYELSPADLVSLPIVGYVGAVGESFNVFNDTHPRERLPFPRAMLKNHSSSNCFVVVVRGECLVGSLIADGDLAICVQADSASDGDIVAVVDGDNAVLKRYRETTEGKWLETDEANGQKRLYRPEYACRIIGKMIGVHREIK